MSTTDPNETCRDPRCPHTNWQGYNRVHYRQADCPQPVTATDQIPAADSEREALIALLLKHGHAEWDRFDAQIVADIVIADWAAPVSNSTPSTQVAPATGSERDERLALAIRGMDHIARHGTDPAVRTDCAHARDVMVSLTALLAEQAATIERVRGVHRPEWMYALADECGHPDDDVHDTIEADSGDLLCMITRAGESCADCRDEDGSRVDYPCETIRALDSQRTEGQG